MEKEIIKSLLEDFDWYKNEIEEGIEFWFARDIQHLLWYTEWRNFEKVINKAKTACETIWESIIDHFVDINKMVNLGSWSQREIKDIMLTRYACYLITVDWDSWKEPVAFAKNYFISKTRLLEKIEQNIKDFERLQARKKLTQTEKQLSELIYEKTWNDKNFWLIRSKWDTALFWWKTTAEMKTRLWIKTWALADVLPTILIKAKDFATEITVFNTKEKWLNTENSISNEHITNNKAVRYTLLWRGIIPENIPAEEDIKKVERRIKSEEKKNIKNIDKFNK